MEPWGTPDNTSTHSDSAFCNTTLYLLPCNIHISHYLPTSTCSNVSFFVAVSVFWNLSILTVFPLTLALHLPSCVSLKIKCNTSQLLLFIFTSFVVKVTSQVFLTPDGGVTGNFKVYWGVQKLMKYPQSLNLHRIFVMEAPLLRYRDKETLSLPPVILSVVK